MMQFDPITPDRIEALVRDLHPGDAQDLHAAGIHNAAEMIEKAAADGLVAFAASYRGRIWCCFGLARWPDSPDVGVPWMLCARYVDEIPPVAVARISRAVIGQMFKDTPILFNLVHNKNRRAVQFLSWLGFTVHDQPAGPGGEFREFTQKDPHHV
jgi:hypothetical protein